MVAAVAVVVLVEEEVGMRIQEEGVADKGIVGEAMEEVEQGGAAEGNVARNSDSFVVVVVGPIEDCNFEDTDLVFAVVVAAAVVVVVVVVVAVVVVEVVQGMAYRRPLLLFLIFLNSIIENQIQVLQLSQYEAELKI